MAFADVDDLEAWVQAEYTSTERRRAALVLELASAVVEAGCDWSIAQVVDDEAVLPGQGSGVLLLPRYPVSAVRSVTVAAIPVAHTWERSGLVRCARWEGNVEVVYTHGYSPVPDVARAVTLQLAARAMANPAGIVGESIGDLSRTYGYGSAGLSLDAAQRALLRRAP